MQLSPGHALVPDSRDSSLNNVVGVGGLLKVRVACESRVARLNAPPVIRPADLEAQVTRASMDVNVGHVLDGLLLFQVVG